MTKVLVVDDDRATRHILQKVLTGAGYEGHLAPWDAFWGMRYAVVHDPDGTPVDLFAVLPAG